MPHVLPATYRRSMRIDVQDHASIVKGASRGFGVLLLGGLIQPAIATTLPGVGAVWLVLVAVAAFALAAGTATPLSAPVGSWQQGPFAAVASYFMIVPLVLVGTGQLPTAQALLTTLTAVVIGSVVGLARVHYAAHIAGTA